MKKHVSLSAALLLLVTGCVTAPPLTWSNSTPAMSDEYKPYAEAGSASVSGQAFLTQRNGGVIKAAGREVTLDPATTMGDEWWEKVGRLWRLKSVTPPLVSFRNARRTMVADADGRFKFEDLPEGEYYIRTEVTWEVPRLGTQGGLVGKKINVNDGEEVNLVLNALAQ